MLKICETTEILLLPFFFFFFLFLGGGIVVPLPVSENSKMLQFCFPFFSSVR